MATALPPWLNVTPQMFLQAAQAGGAQGLQVAQMRQQAAQQEAARQAAAEEMSMRLEMSREAALMDQVARQQAAQQEDRALDIRERFGMAELAMREAEAAQRRQERQAENAPLELRVLNDPTTGKPVGYGYGRTAKWLPPEIPTQGTPMLDQAGNPVATLFGNTVVRNQPRKTLTENEADLIRTNPELIPLIFGGSGVSSVATNAVQSTGGGKRLTREDAIRFKNQANGDRALAERLAREAGYTF